MYLLHWCIVNWNLHTLRWIQHKRNAKEWEEILRIETSSDFNVNESQWIQISMLNVFICKHTTSHGHTHQILVLFCVYGTKFVEIIYIKIYLHRRCVWYGITIHAFDHIIRHQWHWEVGIIHYFFDDGNYKSFG